MKQSNLLLILVGFMIVIGIGLVLYSTKPWEERATKTNAIDVQAQADLKYVRETDKYNLEYPEDVSEDEIIKAFRRLGNQSDPELKTYIRRYKNHASVSVRAAAVQASGAFGKGEFRDLVLRSLDDPSKKVRIAAIKGLGRQGFKNSKSILLNHIQKQSSGYAERVEAHKTLIRIARNVEDQERNVNALLEVLKVVSSERAQPIAMALFKLAPNNDNVLEMAKKVVKGESVKLNKPELLARAIQYTMAYDLNWLKTVFSSLPILNNGVYQRVIIDVAREYCLDGSTFLIEKIIQAPADTAVPELAKQVSCQ